MCCYTQSSLSSDYIMFCIQEVLRHCYWQSPHFPLLSNRYSSVAAHPIQGGPDIGSWNPCECGVCESSRASWRSRKSEYSIIFLFCLEIGYCKMEITFAALRGCFCKSYSYWGHNSIKRYFTFFDHCCHFRFPLQLPGDLLVSHSTCNLITLPLGGGILTNEV